MHDDTHSILGLIRVYLKWVHIMCKRIHITRPHLGFVHNMHVRTHRECGLRPDGLTDRWIDNSEYYNSI